MKCLNCNSTLTCGCQKVKASNGVVVCTKCIKKYEESIKQSKIPPKNTK